MKDRSIQHMITSNTHHGAQPGFGLKFAPPIPIASGGNLIYMLHKTHRVLPASTVNRLTMRNEQLVAGLITDQGTKVLILQVLKNHSNTFGYERKI